MSKRTKRWSRDFWNLWWNRLPSRRLRKFALRRLLGSFGHATFVGLGVKLFDPWSIELGDRTVINADCIIDGRGGAVEIGADTDIGMHTHIWTLEHDPNCPNHGTKGGPVVIGDHVWIATRVTVLPNTTIGRGAVVAAGSVVVKDVPENAIVAGIPAKVIGTRDNPLTYELSHNPRFR